LGIGASMLHLGRPLYAFRAVIGWRRSWLSREIIAFGLYAALAAAYTLASWASNVGSATAIHALGVIAAGVGVFGVICSSMIYAATQRPFWSFPRTAAKFLLSAAVLGLPLVLLVDLATAASASAAVSTNASRAVVESQAMDLLGAIVLAGLVKLLVDASIFGSLNSRGGAPLKRTALLMTGELSRWTKHRFAWGAASIVLPGLVSLVHSQAGAGSLAPPRVIACVVVGLIAAFIGELCERYLFFAAVVAPKMPGAPSA
jgi:DMSO reductase anchor subunit